MKIYVDKMPKATGQGVENQEELEIRMIFDGNKTADNNGFILKDIIIKATTQKLQRDAKQQNCVAKVHSYWLIFKKIANAINELENTKDLQSQLDQQRAMWNELKEFVGKYADTYDESISSICFLILDKMQELEQGEKDGNNK